MDQFPEQNGTTTNQAVGHSPPTGEPPTGGDARPVPDWLRVYANVRTELIERRFDSQSSSSLDFRQALWDAKTVGELREWAHKLGDFGASLCGLARWVCELSRGKPREVKLVELEPGHSHPIRYPRSDGPIISLNTHRHVAEIEPDQRDPKRHRVVAKCPGETFFQLLGDQGVAFYLVRVTGDD
jgi:hypothetical protein